MDKPSMIWKSMNSLPVDRIVIVILVYNSLNLCNISCCLTGIIFCINLLMAEKTILYCRYGR